MNSYIPQNFFYFFQYILDFTNLLISRVSKYSSRINLKLSLSFLLVNTLKNSNIILLCHIFITSIHLFFNTSISK